jgi:hypothetical protein
MSTLEIFINLEDTLILTYTHQGRFSFEFFKKVFILIYIFKESFETH